MNKNDIVFECKTHARETLIQHRNNNGKKIRKLIYIGDEAKPPYNFSPTGFNWGYNGSGPSQLAHSIIKHWFQNTILALIHYKIFREKIISKKDKTKNFELKYGDIKEMNESFVNAVKRTNAAPNKDIDKTIITTY